MAQIEERATVYREIGGRGAGFYGALAVYGLLILLALAAARYMEHQGHHVTGMTNQVVWGLPHVFAIFMIVAASGALNVASIGTVFGRAAYKPLGRLSGLLAIALSGSFMSPNSIARRPRALQASAQAGMRPRPSSIRCTQSVQLSTVPLPRGA